MSMRLVHIADTHFGKQLKKINFAEQDQPYWLECFLKKMDELKPDMVMVAGDIFDVKMPGQEATALWDRLLVGLAERGIKVCAVPGNHDLAARIAEKSELIRQLGVHMVGPLGRELQHFALPLETGEQVNFWLLPYLMPSSVNQCLDRRDILDYNEAMREYLAAQPINYAELNVLVAHQNILSGTQKRLLNDNERTIGFSGEIDAALVEGFDYVALGHIHAAQHVGKEHIRYAGAPLQYDFSEEGRWRGFVLIDIKGKGDIQISKVELPPLHQLVVVPQATSAAGVQELLELGKSMEDKEHKYIKVRVLYEEMAPEVQKLLEEAFGDTLLEVEPVKSSAEPGLIVDLEHEDASMEEVFQEYYRFVKNAELTETQQEVIRMLVEKQVNGEFLNPGSSRNADQMASEHAGTELVELVEKLLEKEQAHEIK